MINEFRISKIFNIYDRKSRGNSWDVSQLLNRQIPKKGQYIFNTGREWQNKEIAF